MKIVLFLFFFIFSSAWAQIETEKWIQETDDPMIYDKIQKNKDITLQNDILYKEKNSVTGVYDTIHYTGHEQNSLTALLHLNSSVQVPFNLIGLELEYWRKLTRTWLTFSGNYIKSQFGELTLNRTAKSNSRNASAEENFQRKDSSAVTLMSGGMGFGYRFRPQLSFWPTLESADVFHSVSAYLTYNLMHDDFRGKDYTGPGISADYQLNKRFGSDWGIGGKFAYHIAWVKRARENTTEPSTDTQLNLSWASLAVSLAYFF